MENISKIVADQYTTIANEIIAPQCTPESFLEKINEFTNKIVSEYKYEIILMIAIIHCNVPLCQLLLSLNLFKNINCIYQDYTILTLAAIYLRGKSEIFKILLEKGADVNMKNGYQNTPLIYAAKYNNNVVAKILIDYGANLDLVNDNGDTALIVAASLSCFATVELLVVNGANINISNKYGILATHYPFSNIIIKCVLVKKDRIKKDANYREGVQLKNDFYAIV